MTRPPEPAFFEKSASCPQCGGVAEPEQDGDVVYFACSDEDCGAEFGHRRAVQPGPVCAAGLPVEVREPAAAAPVFLGTTITRRPE